MYNLSRLSDTSRSFLSNIRSGSLEQNKVIALALAMAISKIMVIPSAPVDDEMNYYDSNVLNTVQEAISQVNELALIDTRITLEFTRILWKARYRTLYPSGKIFLNVTTNSFTSALASFFGFGNILTAEILSIVDKNNDQLFPLTNGFSALVTELIVPETVEPQENVGA